jgi:hypothetical protein
MTCCLTIGPKAAGPINHGLEPPNHLFITSISDFCYSDEKLTGHKYQHDGKTPFPQAITGIGQVSKEAIGF